MRKIVFDIESTGLSTKDDRIVELGIMIIDHDGTILSSKSKRYNPGIPIAATATAAHGITDKDVRNCPYFKEDAAKIAKLFEDAVIIGYNSKRFDIPMLLAEFARAGVVCDFSLKIIDVLEVEKKVHQRTLSTIYQQYTGKVLEGAHGATADLEATYTILQHQIEKFKLKPDQLYEMSGTKGMIDIHGKFTRNEQGDLIVNFGQKCKGERLLDNPSFAEWMLKSDFPESVKKMIQDEQKKAVQGTFKKEVAKPARKQQSFDFGKVTKTSTPPKNGGWKPVDIPDDIPF